MRIFFLAMVTMLILLINLKLLSKDWKISLWEVPYSFIAMLIIGGVRLMLSRYFSLLTPLSIYLFPQLFLLIFTLKKGYTLKKSFIITPLAIFVLIVSEFLAWLPWRFFFPDAYGLTEQRVDSPLMIFLFILLIALTSFSLALIFKSVTKEMRHKVNHSTVLQSQLAILMMVSLLVMNTLSTLYPIIYEHILIESWIIETAVLVLIIIFAGGLTGILIFYIKNLEKQNQLKFKEEEQRNLLYYTDAIETQYTNMRKFKHDYQNILLSLNEFIEEKDLEGLTHYFNEKIKSVSEKMIKQNFALENLSRIKVKEIKSILAMKLMMAQEKGIVVQLEIKEEIHHIPMNTVNLVRMLGILLDNAIEALIDLDEKKDCPLIIGIWSDEENLTILIQNTCCEQIPKLHELRQTGFSTKGENRGLGLSNLFEMAAEESNVWLDTSIEKNQFIQKIIIETH